MSFLWHGLTDQGTQVPVQVDAQGRVIAVDGSPGVSNWVNTGTELYPLNNESVIIGGTLPASPNINLNANGSATFGVTGVNNSDKGSVNTYPVGRLQIDGTVPSAGEATSYFINCRNNGSDKFIVSKGGSATFAGDVTAANITFRSTDPSYYAKTGDYSGPEVSLVEELIRLEALVNHLYEELGVSLPAQIKTKVTNLMKLRIPSTQGKKKQ